jgi:hypothetical protein
MLLMRAFTTAQADCLVLRWAVCKHIVVSLSGLACLCMRFHGGVTSE